MASLHQRSERGGEDEEGTGSPGATKFNSPVKKKKKTGKNTPVVPTTPVTNPDPVDPVPGPPIQVPVPVHDPVPVRRKKNLCRSLGLNHFNLPMIGDIIDLFDWDKIIAVLLTAVLMWLASSVMICCDAPAIEATVVTGILSTIFKASATNTLSLSFSAADSSGLFSAIPRPGISNTKTRHASKDVFSHEHFLCNSINSAMMVSAKTKLGLCQGWAPYQPRHCKEMFAREKIEAFDSLVRCLRGLTFKNPTNDYDYDNQDDDEVDDTVDDTVEGVQVDEEVRNEEGSEEQRPAKRRRGNEEERGEKRKREEE